VLEAHGALAVPWGDVHRIRYAGRDLPGNGASGDPGGVFRVAHYERAQEGDAVSRLVAGDSYYAVVEFSDPVRARVLTAYGNATREGSPHHGDQLELFAEQRMREVWRTREAVLANLERRESF
jgi:acyl-homoserine-lactone acylase